MHHLRADLHDPDIVAPADARHHGVGDPVGGRGRPHQPDVAIELGVLGRNEAQAFGNQAIALRGILLCVGDDIGFGGGGVLRLGGVSGHGGYSGGAFDGQGARLGRGRGDTKDAGERSVGDPLPAVQGWGGAGRGWGLERNTRNWMSGQGGRSDGRRRIGARAPTRRTAPTVVAPPRLLLSSPSRTAAPARR